MPPAEQRHRKRQAPGAGQPQKPGTNQKVIKELIREISGQANILAIPRVFIRLTGDVKGALLLSQCVYWSDRGRNADGWFYKSHEEWSEELGLSPHDIRVWAGTAGSGAAKEGEAKEGEKKKRRLGKKGRLGQWLDVKLKMARGAPTTHYRVRMDDLLASLTALLQEEEEGDEGPASPETGATRVSESAEFAHSETRETPVPDTAKIAHSETRQAPVPDSANITDSIIERPRNQIVRELTVPDAAESANSTGTYTETTQTIAETEAEIFDTLIPHTQVLKDRREDCDAIWEQVLSLVKLQVPGTAFNDWVKKSYGLAYEAGLFVIGVPNIYVKGWLSNRMDATIRKMLARVMEKDAVETWYVVTPRPTRSDEPEVPLAYRVGQRVGHPRYGEGIVIASTWTEEDAQVVTVDFAGTLRRFAVD